MLYTTGGFYEVLIHYLILIITPFSLKITIFSRILSQKFTKARMRIIVFLVHSPLNGSPGINRCDGTGVEQKEIEFVGIP
jgi:hypothetical protein